MNRRDIIWKGIKVGIIVGFIAAMILYGALVLLSGAEAEERPWTGWIVCTEGGEINVREKATTSSATVGRLYFGDRVTVTKTVKGWCWCTNLSTDLGAGWVSAAFVAASEPTADGERYTVVAKGRVAVYDGIHGRKRVMWIQPGETVRVWCWAMSDKGLMAYTDRGFIREAYLYEQN